MVFVFLFSYLVAVGVLNPMKKLIEGAEIVGQGNLDYKVNIKSNDEVQNLAEQFNKMTDGLKKIESLTRALAKEKELSVIKSQFLTTVSHQLNTPVTEINWALQSIDFEDKENIKLAISSIKTGSQNISDIISDVLTLSDIGFDYKPKNIEKIKLNEIIDAVLQKYAASIQEKNIKIDFNPNAVFEIQAEKNTISKLFEELIENAIIYNNQNGTIDIYLSRTDADKDEKIIVSIKDTGIGIPFDDRQFIFKEIFRAKNAPSGKNVGTGMGLLIARIITEGHNGKIWFSGRGGSALGGESKEGEGTTFYLQLPA
jgi:signal transduction histidine kinase